MSRHLARFRAAALAGTMLILPAAAQQAAPPVAVPALPAAPPAAVLAPAADAKVIVVGSVVQLRSGGPKLTVVDLAPTVATVQWYVDNSFKKESFPIAALKLVDASDDDDEEEDDDEDEDEDE
ncbi:MAG TPA: DUF2158 domain-containing protein [Beijerinckiaceae bacterium]|nr:DUF2158 domain-containing protein [Beijerinckiaceae bacterium]